MTVRLLLVVVILSFFPQGCGRPLTHAEKSFTQSILGEQIDTKSVRVMNGALIGNVTRKRRARPQIACRERIWPVPETEIVTTSTSAFVLFNKVFVSRYFYSEDFLEGYPEKIPLAKAMRLAHELTHVWQWQNRDITGYHPARGASEHEPGTDPYLFELNATQQFLDFPYEQQASIVEEYVCCRTLDPNGARTSRLQDLLQNLLPPQSTTASVPGPEPILPWQEAKTKGICS
ncbi:MAG: hypothetical protein GY947_03185 [Rhodobacteraceae bacterium]|nr:hypothetical protein [Paracoccaceae bacterium]